jgi:predicted nucleotidyltransferase component of viral defense system
MTKELLFDKDRLENLLDMFLGEIEKRGVKGTVFLVGGAALSLYYFERDSTRDIDAGFPVDPVISEVIQEIALREKLPANWINNEAAMYFGFPPSSYWITKRTIGDVTLKVASPELMLAMKIKASRGRRDNEDVVELLRILGLSSIEEVLAIYENVYAQEEMNLETMELVTQFLTNQP